MSAWGGKRDKAGRPSTGVNKTVVVRIDKALLPAVNQIKARYKETGSLHGLINVTTNQGLLDNQKSTEAQAAQQTKAAIYCLFCNKSFIPKRNTAKFCSYKCRKANHVAIKKKQD